MLKISGFNSTLIGRFFVIAPQSQLMTRVRLQKLAEQNQAEPKRVAEPRAGAATFDTEPQAANGDKVSYDPTWAWVEI